MSAAALTLDDTDARFDRLCGAVRDAGPCVVALSGGVDSSLIALAARAVFGREQMRAVTGISQSLSTTERAEIEAFVTTHDIPWVALDTHEMDLAGYRENSPDRCLFCKTELYGTLRAYADDADLDAVLDGTHVGDLSAHRPSLAAAERYGVRSLLVELGFTKDDVRALAKAKGLSMWDRPAAPCLASRVAYGVEVTPERLTRVAAAESALKALGFDKLRVRLHDEIARIEVPKADLVRVAEHAADISAALKAAGFVYVTLDLEGFRSGSLLEVLQPR